MQVQESLPPNSFPANLSTEITNKLGQDYTSTSVIHRLQPQELIEFFNCSVRDQKFYDENRKFVAAVLKTTETTYGQEFIDTHFPNIKITNENRGGEKEDAPTESEYPTSKILYPFDQGLQADEMHPQSKKFLINFSSNKQLPKITHLDAAEEILAKSKELNRPKIADALVDHCVVNRENAFYYYELAETYQATKFQKKILEFLKNQIEDLPTAKRLIEKMESLEKQINNLSSEEQFQMGEGYSILKVVCYDYISNYDTAKNQNTLTSQNTGEDHEKINKNIETHIKHAEKSLKYPTFSLPVNLDASIAKKISECPFSKVKFKGVEEWIIKELNHDEILLFLRTAVRDETYYERNQTLLKQLGKYVASLEIKENQIEEYFPKCLFQLNDRLVKMPSLHLHFLNSVFFSSLLNTKVGELKIDLSDLRPESQEIIINYLLKGEFPPLSDTDIAKEVFERCMEYNLNIEQEFARQCEINAENAIYFYEMETHYYHDGKISEKALKVIKENLNDPKEAAQLYAYANSNKFGRLKNLCFDYFDNGLVLAIKAVSKKDRSVELSEKSSEDENEIFLEEAMKIITVIPKNFLIHLNAEELIYVLDHFPEKIKKLNLSIYTDDEIQAIAHHIPETLRKLDLSHAALTNETIDTIAKRCPLLESLILEEACKWNKNDPLKPHLESWENLLKFVHLESINVSYCPEAAPYLEKLLENNASHLKSLKMANCHLTNSIWHSQEQGFTFWKTPQFEFQEEKSFCNSCLRILGEKGKSLKELDISDQKISFQYLNLLSKNHQKLERLSIAKTTGLSKSEFIKIASRFPNLESLDISNGEHRSENVLREIIKRRKNTAGKLRELYIAGFSYNDKTSIYHYISKEFPNIKEVHYIAQNGGYSEWNVEIEYNVAKKRHDLISKVKALKKLVLLPSPGIHFDFKNIADLPNLETLMAPGEYIEVLLDHPNLLKKLKSLQIQLKEVKPSYDDLFKPMQKLAELELYLDQDQALEAPKLLQALIDNTNIEYLELSFNEDRESESSESSSHFPTDCLKALTGVKRLINLNINTTIDQENLIKLIENNSRLKTVKNIFNVDKPGRQWLTDMTRLENGEFVLEVHSKKSILKEAMASVSYNYPEFKVIGQEVESKSNGF